MQYKDLKYNTFILYHEKRFDNYLYQTSRIKTILKDAEKVLYLPYIIRVESKRYRILH